VYPFTLQGLLERYRMNAQDRNLLQAIMQNGQYKALVERLTHDKKLSEERVFRLIVESPWQELSQLEERGGESDVRRLFIQKMIPHAPKDACNALYELDPMYAVHTLDDRQVLVMLESLDRPNLVKEYALKLFMGMRSSGVRKHAALVLCQLAGFDPKTTTKDVLLRHYGVQRPCAATPPSTKSVSIKKPEPIVKRPVQIVHTVAKGENLWSIAKKYKVDVKAIKRVNSLQTDALQPGTQLKIPVK
jgi:hypothetical protein